jgi:hypothetical protein
VDDLPVGALPEEQRLPFSVKQNGSYPANDYYVSRVRQQRIGHWQKILNPSTSPRDIER